MGFSVFSNETGKEFEKFIRFEIFFFSFSFMILLFYIILKKLVKWLSTISFVSIYPCLMSYIMGFSSFFLIEFFLSFIL